MLLLHPAFGIGSMVYSGLEFGLYFELKKDSHCHNVLLALTPLARMFLAIAQMQFIFINSKVGCFWYTNNSPNCLPSKSCLSPFSSSTAYPRKKY